MKLEEQAAALAVANVIELTSRVLKNLVGEELSARIDDQEVSANSEAMLASSIRAKLEAREV